MKKMNVMSGMLAFSFPCIIGVGIASPKVAQADGQILVDTIMYNQNDIDAIDINDKDSMSANYKAVQAIR